MKKLLSYIILTGLFIGANSTNCGAYSWSKEQASKVYQKAKSPMAALLVGSTGLATYAFYQAYKALPSYAEAAFKIDYPGYIKLNFEPKVSAGLMFLGIAMLAYASLTDKKASEEPISTK